MLNTTVPYAPASFLDSVRCHLIGFQSYAKLTGAEIRIAACARENAPYDAANTAAIIILGRRRKAALKRWRARDPEGVRTFERYFGKEAA